MNQTPNAPSNAALASIFPLNQSSSFSQRQAFELIDSLYVVTAKAKNKISALSGHVEYNKRIPAQAETFQNMLNEEIQKWSEKVRRLGGIPLGLYKVKIVAEEGGYYTWEFPSADLSHKK